MAENSSGKFQFEPERENLRLQEENARLRKLLSVHGIPIPEPAPDTPPTSKSTKVPPAVNKEERARKRILLFRNLFRGRDDIYARRWENSDGRTGYSPAIIKDWDAINKSRPSDRKKVNEKTRKLFQ